MRCRPCPTAIVVQKQNVKREVLSHDRKERPVVASMSAPAHCTLVKKPEPTGRTKSSAIWYWILVVAFVNENEQKFTLEPTNPLSNVDGRESLTLVRQAVVVAIGARADRGELANIRSSVAIAIGLALVGDAVSVAVIREP